MINMLEMLIMDIDGGGSKDDDDDNKESSDTKYYDKIMLQFYFRYFYISF
jgi:hypothetical protein